MTDEDVAVYSTVITILGLELGPQGARNAAANLRGQAADAGSASTAEFFNAIAANLDRFAEDRLRAELHTT